LTHAVSMPMLVFVWSIAMGHQNDGSMYHLRNTGNLPGEDLPEMWMSRSNRDARTSSQTLVARNLGLKWFAVPHGVEILSVTACAPARLGEGQRGLEQGGGGTRVMGPWAPPDPSKVLIDALEWLRLSTTPARQKANGSGCYLTLIKCRIDEDICTAAEVCLPCSTYKSNAANMASAVIVARTIGQILASDQ
jgi:hypothetical protein